MSRLPQPGGDQDTWGNVLNDFLSQSHNTDGTLKTDSVGAVQLKPNAVASASIADGAVTNAKLDPATQTSLGKADTALQIAPVTSVVGQTGAITGTQIAADAALTSTYTSANDLNAEVTRAQNAEGANTTLIAGSIGIVFKQGASWPTRPTGYGAVLWVGATPGPSIGTVGGAVDGIDMWDEV